jgi:hypothetical protein
MTRVLIVCLAAVILIQPAAAGTGQSDAEQVTNRPHLFEGMIPGDLSEAAPWARSHTDFSSGAIQPRRTALASVTRATGTSSPCGQKLAFGLDARCVSACDAAKESCDRHCGSARTTCLAQCLGIGFMCDYHCHAVYFICKGNCGRAHDTCVSNCTTRGGEKES